MAIFVLNNRPNKNSIKYNTLSFYVKSRHDLSKSSCSKIKHIHTYEDGFKELYAIFKRCKPRPRTVKLIININKRCFS